MSLKNRSINTINSPEFINLQPLEINPLMSSCEIKVLYIGQNRNKSYISKEVAVEMAKTLRGAPIVGYYKQDKKDFSDHGERVILDDEGIHFECLTKPYGFVAPDAKVWFQDFEDYDEFDNVIVRTYLMTTGFLWTGQFEQIQKVFDDGGQPQSMELDEKSLEGHWAKNINKDVEFFIINDATFSKLCILGNEVEPCFEGASVTKTFSLDDNFKHSLFKMMQELTQVLKGGQDTVEKDENKVLDEKNFSLEQQKNEDKNETFSLNENQENVTEEKVQTSFVDKEKEEEKQEEPAAEEDSDSKEDEEKEDDNKKKYELLQNDYNELKNSFQALEKECEELRAFKLKIENEQKDNLINEFYMLSDKDKEDVINNKTNYSFEQIKSKLAVICFEKKVNFSLDDSSKNEELKEEPITTFNINNQEDSTPDWVKQVELNMNKI